MTEPTPQQVHIDTTERKRKKKKMPDEIAKNEMPIWKSKSDQHIVYGIVLEPNLVDTDGDIITEDEIAKAAQNFLVESRKQDVQHSAEQAPIWPVESYCAPHDLLLHGQLVKGGSWVLACKVKDDDVWDRISNPENPEPLTGYSIQGLGIRTPL